MATRVICLIGGPTRSDFSLFFLLRRDTALVRILWRDRGNALRRVDNTGFTLAMSAVTEDGRCVKWSSLKCHTVKGPDRGDLAIVLPDDEASLAEALRIGRRGNSCFLMSRVTAWRSGCAHLFATLSAIFA